MSFRRSKRLLKQHKVKKKQNLDNVNCNQRTKKGEPICQNKRQQKRTKSPQQILKHKTLQTSTLRMPIQSKTRPNTRAWLRKIMRNEILMSNGQQEQQQQQQQQQQSNSRGRHFFTDSLSRDAGNWQRCQALQQSLNTNSTTANSVKTVNSHTGNTHSINVNDDDDKDNYKEEDESDNSSDSDWLPSSEDESSDTEESSDVSSSEEQEDENKEKKEFFTLTSKNKKRSNGGLLWSKTDGCVVSLPDSSDCVVTHRKRQTNPVTHVGHLGNEKGKNRQSCRKRQKLLNENHVRSPGWFLAASVLDSKDKQSRFSNHSQYEASPRPPILLQDLNKPGEEPILNEGDNVNFLGSSSALLSHSPLQLKINHQSSIRADKGKESIRQPPSSAGPVAKSTNAHAFVSESFEQTRQNGRAESSPCNPLSLCSTAMIQSPKTAEPHASFPLAVETNNCVSTRLPTRFHIVQPMEHNSIETQQIKPISLSPDEDSIIDQRDLKNSERYGWIYVLECAQGKYYVGKTLRYPNWRMVEHQVGIGSKWTMAYPPLRLAQVFAAKEEYAEDQHTIELMARYGIQNVRGGTFVQIKLPPYQQQTLVDMLRTRGNACFLCGQGTHFASTCPIKQRTRGTHVSKKTKTRL